MVGEVSESNLRIPLDKAEVVCEGSDITVVCYSYLVPEALRCAKFLAEKNGVSVEVIDLCSIHPIDWKTIDASVQKTGRLLALDTSHEQCSISSEVVARAAEKHWGTLRVAPQRMALPNHPTPTSKALTEEYYFDAVAIMKQVMKMTGANQSFSPEVLRKPGHHDVPGDWFSGPF